ncbi:MAG: aminotransferase class V-fold PLP-dependent enzyme [Armatimonadota bacterium]|nr:aminotransferase class V-fold PLP-dependent enzyme [Armatimonadota bacterium]MDR7532380.1 aminotransferase class V-fold PLP-dependent enzyme [Armatimonadota bacterium]MDR7535307.1 aminotransferase class V-fold PLP-dependent enzyme [Armatimonadota bacterium]
MPAPDQLPMPGAAAPDWGRWRQEFPIFRRAVYFNTCSLGALSVRVEAAVRRFLDLWHAHGAAAWYGPWWERLAALRAKCARVIGAAPEEVALFPSITAALTAVASAVWDPRRPRVVVSRLDFPTTVYQWLAREPTGLAPSVVGDPDAVTTPVEAYAAAADVRTSLIVASHVYYTSGYVQDVAALADLAHRRGALCLIDAYQATGQLPTDVRALGVDFLVTGGLKWLLGGPGFAFLYVRRELHEHLHPSAVGWFAHRDQFAFRTDRFEPAADARRFEGGTPALAAAYAADAGLEIVLEIGATQLRRRQLELVADLVDRLRAAGLTPRVPIALDGHAGIVTVPVPDPPGVVTGLRARGIVVDARPGLVRLSPYFYNTPDDSQQVVAALREVLAAGAPAP